MLTDKDKGVHVDAAFREFAEQELPFGLWQQKPGCNFSSVRKAGSFAGASRPSG